MLFCTPDLTRFIPYFILLVFLFTLVCRWIVFKKMHIRPWISLIPFVREYKIFRKCWKVWPFLLLTLLAIAFAFFVQITGYLDINLAIPPYIKSNFRILALLCVLTIFVALYKRLAFAFGHDIGYLMGLLFLNPLFMGFLAFKKSNVFNEERTQLRGKELKEYLSKTRGLRNRILSTISAVVIAVAGVGFIGYVMVTEQQPGVLIKSELNKTYAKTAGNVSGHGPVIYPALEKNAIESNGVRALYFPDKSKVKETTVYMYIIGSDLEDNNGSASINLAQIKDATAAGDKLKFIIEAGGTGRWFTKGFKNRKTARYIIENGEITLLEVLPTNTCMTDYKTLRDFLKWANANYPSDRKMLYFWDHGGGIAGYGKDLLSDEKPDELMPMSDIVSALRVSGEKYDLIGFDACFMQTMEVGLCMEPYADYLLASEETEPHSGHYYTAAFSRLANEPDLSTLKFGAMMCSSYDQSLELLNDAAQAGSTLSMIDLRYMPVVHDTFLGYLQTLDANFRIDRSSFINMSTARSKAYEFQMEDQIDLIDFIKHSDLPSDAKASMVGKIKKAILVRNAASANHINGMAVYMPYDNLYSYSNVHKDLKKLRMKSETAVYNDFASIIASQKRKKNDNNYGYYTDEDWYEKGFENYNISLFKQDIKLIKQGDDYKIDLSDEDWETITGYEQGLKMKVGKRYADLGSDNVFDLDDKGHYMLEFNDTWVAINGVVVALHPGTPKNMGNGEIVYSGTVDAMLNFIHPITIYIEWVDVGDQEGEGKVLGYLPADADSNDIDETGMPRGFKQFKSSNYVTFLYDWYDESGNYLSTAMGHLPINVGTYGLRVTQKDISSEDYFYYGILRDVMNREIRTETLHHKAGE